MAVQAGSYDLTAPRQAGGVQQRESGRKEVFLEPSTGLFLKVKLEQDNSEQLCGRRSDFQLSYKEPYIELGFEADSCKAECSQGERVVQAHAVEVFSGQGMK